MKELKEQSRKTRMNKRKPRDYTIKLKGRRIRKLMIKNKKKQIKIDQVTPQKVALVVVPALVVALVVLALALVLSP